MRIAALQEVHGNRPALEAVVNATGDVDGVVFGGEVILGPWPTESADLLRALPYGVHAEA